MITDRLFTVIASLEISSEIGEDIIKNFLLYTLKIKSNYELRKFCRDFNPIIRKELLDLKQNFFDKTFYTLSRYWRAVYALLGDEKSCKRCKWFATCHPVACGWCREFLKTNESVSVEFGITERDLGLLEYLSKSELNKIKSKAKKLSYIEHPDQLYYHNMMSVLIPYCQKLAYKKLYFIKKYNNYDMEDLINDLLTVAMGVIIVKDVSDDFYKTLNYTKKSIRERAKNLIEFYTFQKRRRLSIESDGYAMTTLSLDIPENTEDFSSSLSGTTTDSFFHLPVISDIDTMRLVESKDFMDKLYGICSPKQQQVVKAILGVAPKEFNVWLRKKGEEHFGMKLARNAASFFDMSQKEFKDLGKKIKHLSM